MVRSEPVTGPTRTAPTTQPAELLVTKKPVDRMDATVTPGSLTLSPTMGISVPPQSALYEQTPIAKAIGSTYGSVRHVTHGAALALGQRLQTAAGSLRQASAELGPTPLGTQVEALSSAYERFSNEVDLHLARPFFDAEAVQTRAQRLIDDGNELSSKVEATGLSGALARVTSAVKSAYEAVVSFKDDIAGALDYREHISKLGLGDSYLVSLDGQVDVTFARAKGRGSLAIRRDEQGYTVALDGGVGGGVVASSGFSLGPVSALAQLAAVVEGGSAAEFHFETAEQATQAVEVLTGTKRTIPVTESTPHDSRDDLLGNMSSFEVLGGALGEHWSSMGAAIGGNAIVESRAHKSFKVVSGEEGPELRVTTRFTSLGRVDAGTLFDQVSDQHLHYGGGHQAELSFVRAYRFPPGITFDDVRRSPISSLTEHRSSLKPAGADQVEFTFETESANYGETRGRHGVIRFEGDLSDFSAKALSKFAVGDLNGVVASLPSVPLTGESRPFQKHGLRMMPSMSVGGAGALALFIAQRRDVRPEDATTFSGSPAEVAVQFAKTQVLRFDTLSL